MRFTFKVVDLSKKIPLYNMGEPHPISLRYEENKKLTGHFAADGLQTSSATSASPVLEQTAIS